MKILRRNLCARVSLASSPDPCYKLTASLDFSFLCHSRFNAVGIGHPREEQSVDIRIRVPSVLEFPTGMPFLRAASSPRLYFSFISLSLPYPYISSIRHGTNRRTIIHLSGEKFLQMRSMISRRIKVVPSWSRAGHALRYLILSPKAFRAPNVTLSLRAVITERIEPRAPPRFIRSRRCLFAIFSPAF